MSNEKVLCKPLFGRARRYIDQTKSAAADFVGDLDDKADGIGESVKDLFD